MFARRFSAIPFPVVLIAVIAAFLCVNAMLIVACPHQTTFQLKCPDATVGEYNNGFCAGLIETACKRAGSREIASGNFDVQYGPGMTITGGGSSLCALTTTCDWVKVQTGPTTYYNECRPSYSPYYAYSMTSGPCSE